MQDSYLECLKKDIENTRKELKSLKDNYEKVLIPLEKKLELLLQDENKVMERLTGKKRCHNCGEFVTVDKQFGNPHQYIGTHGDTKYNCN